MTVDAPTVPDTYFYRVRAENDLGYSPWSPTVAAIVPALVAPRLGTPAVSPSRPRHNVTFTVAGTIGSADPRAGVVTLTVQRRSGSSWVSAGTFRATLAAHAVRYSLRIRLSRAGSYRIRASHAADSVHLAGVSSWRSFTVR